MSNAAHAANLSAFKFKNKSKLFKIEQNPRPREGFEQGEVTFVPPFIDTKMKNRSHRPQSYSIFNSKSFRSIFFTMINQNKCLLYKQRKSKPDKHQKRDRRSQSPCWQTGATSMTEEPDKLQPINGNVL